MEEITTWAKKHWRHRIFKPCISNIQKCCWLLWSQVEKSSLGCWIHRSKFLEIMKAASFGVKWNSCIQSVTNIDFQTRHLRQHLFQRQPCLPQQENAETYSACLTTAWPHNNECRHYTGQTSLDPPTPHCKCVTCVFHWTKRSLCTSYPLCNEDVVSGLPYIFLLIKLWNHFSTVMLRYFRAILVTEGGSFSLMISFREESRQRQTAKCHFAGKPSGDYNTNSNSISSK